ncbi:MAG TPA: c-type cytochrome [Caldimonas sp.]|nr:c-type cytochrome [Caldimonas sp.]
MTSVRVEDAAVRGTPWLGWLVLVIALVAFARLAWPARADPAWQIAGADARRGRALVRDVGCPACHTIPGLRGARGNVGPPLTRFADRTYVAGVLRNEPRNLVTWLRHPQQVVPGNAMPEMGLDERDARDIAAYLYTLR